MTNLARRILIGVALAVAVIGTIAFFTGGKTAPTLQEVKKSSLSTWNRLESVYVVPNESIDCDYDPAKFRPSYKFTCNIYDGQGYQIGTVNSTVEAGGNANDGWPMNVETQPY
jgi:hypothetical protein